MSTLTAERPTTQEPKLQALSREKLLTAIAAAVAAHGLRNLGGIDRIEERFTPETLAGQPIASTVFAVINEELSNLNVETDGTVGGVMEALGYARGSEEALDKAHDIGCNCHGDFISPAIASERILHCISTAAVA